MMFETSIAGSLPKPDWLAEPNKLCRAWKLYGDELAAAEHDALLSTTATVAASMGCRIGRTRAAVAVTLHAALSWG